MICVGLVLVVVVVVVGGVFDELLGFDIFDL